MSMTRLYMAGAVALALAITALPDRASAATLNVIFNDQPDIVSFQLAAVYTASDGVLTVDQAETGANTIDFVGGTPGTLASGSFLISANLGDLSNPTGTLTIGETGTGDGLFEATLAAIGNDGTQLQFLWNITNDDTGAFGSQAFTQLNNSGFQGNGNSDFLLDFSTTIGGTGVGGAAADTKAVIPVPAALPLMASVMAAFGALGWRRRRKTQAS